MQKCRENLQRRYFIGGVCFDNLNLRAAVADTLAASKRRSAQPIRFANAYSVATASRDSSYKEVLNGPGRTYADGISVVAANNIVNRKIKAEQVRGPSFFRAIHDEGRKQELRHYLYGTTEATLERLVAKLEDLYPGLAIVGTRAPAYGEIGKPELEAAAKHISVVDAGIVWVALGTPKQDFVAAELSQMISIPCVGIGAAFDFVSGSVREAPSYLQGSGFEWAYRLAQDPKRLWRRYLFGNIQFVQAVVSGTIPSRVGRRSQ